MRFRPFLIIAVFTLTSSSIAVAADLNVLSQSKQWLRLLHFTRPSLLRSQKSEVGPGDFFLSPEGSHDPLAELQADIQAFTKTQSPTVGHFNVHPQCAFPARYHFLKNELHWTTADVECSELDTYLKKIHGDELSLIFSSAYPNSPPSMFGHTFFRVHSHDRADLLDYGINYSALVGEDDNSVAFAVLGLMGGYYGQFGIVPYYIKVNEYNHAESRDLWEYDLSLSPGEIRVLLWHIWELQQNAAFKYYFFDENCSYRLLTVLEVAKPEWDLSDFAVDVIPAETVKRLVAIPGAVKAIHHRPSLRVRMAAQFDRLSSEERQQALRVARENEDVRAIKNPAVLEAAISYLQFRRLKGKLHLDEADQKRFTAALVQRASLGLSANEVDDNFAPVSSDLENRPELGHAPYLIRVGGGSFTQDGTSTGYEELHFKTAYHDLLNSDVGYLPFSEVNFPSLTLRYSQELNSLWIEHLTLMSVTSLAPMTDLEKQISWKADLSYITPKDLNCVNCHAAMLEGGAGAAEAFLSNRVLVYGLGLLHFEDGSSIQNGFRFTPKLLTAALLQPTLNYKTQLSAAAVADVWQSVRQSHFYELEWLNSMALSQNWEIRASAKTVLPGDRQENVTYRDFSATLNHYF
jgi:Domain of unknown function (DUF4105)